MPVVEGQLQGLARSLQRTLADSLLAAEITGAGEVAASIPASLLTATTGLGFLPPAPPSDVSSREAFGREPEVRFPIVERAVEELADSPVFAGQDFRETAEAVNNGAFAITGELEEETVGRIRDLLTENIAEGPDLPKFIRDTRELLDEGSGLSDARIDMVFRNNVGAAIADGKERALRNPIVEDAFPYRRRNATFDDRVRPAHKQLEFAGLNGTDIYNKDDPAWQALRAPWSWNCRCTDFPVSVRSAARGGVREAQDWLARAEEMADEFGGRAELYFEQTKPIPFEFVPWPTLNGQRIVPDPNFRRADNLGGVAQFSEWQLGRQTCEACGQ